MEQKSILEHITEHDVVTVHNPLSDEFVAKVSRSVVAPARPQAFNPTGNSNADALLQGIQSSIANGGHTSMAHVQQSISIKAGQTLRLPGDVARVVVRQLVKEMMQREGQTKQMANSEIFMEYERRVVLDHESMLTNLSVETAEERLNRQLADLNKVPEAMETEQHEREFPTEKSFERIGTDAGAGKQAAGNIAIVSAATSTDKKRNK